MPQHGRHHIHQRERVHKLKQPYPHPNRKLKIIDDLCMVFSVLMPATAIPQIYKTFHLQDASGLSLWMWILYSMGVIPFLLYGIVHKVKHLIVLNVLWLSVQLTMIVAILIYG